MCNAKRLEDVLQEILVQCQSGGALDADSCPIDVDPILPSFAGLVDQGLRKVIVLKARELVKTRGPVEVIQALIKE